MLTVRNFIGHKRLKKKKDLVRKSCTRKQKTKIFIVLDYQFLLPRRKLVSNHLNLHQMKNQI